MKKRTSRKVGVRTFFNARCNFTSHYKLGKTLGKGSFAVTKRCVDKVTDKAWAAKVMNFGKMDDDDLQALEQEVSILRGLKHPNICGLREVFQDKDMFYMVMEEMKGGELFDRIVEKEYYTETEAAKVIREVCSALAYCHKKGVTHRDLKPENILYATTDADSEVQVADFGLAAIVSNDTLMRTACGTPEYVAPEVLRKQPYTTQVDMWSVGVITYILLCGYPPFEDENTRQLYNSIKTCDVDYAGEGWDFVSAQGIKFVKSLIAPNPKLRLTAAKVLEHPWIVERVEAPSTSKVVKLDGAKHKLKAFLARRRLKAAMRAVLNIAVMRKKTGASSRKKKGAAASASAGGPSAKKKGCILC